VVGERFEVAVGRFGGQAVLFEWEAVLTTEVGAGRLGGQAVLFEWEVVLTTDVGAGRCGGQAGVSVAVGASGPAAGRPGSVERQTLGRSRRSDRPRPVPALPIRRLRAVGRRPSRPEGMPV
jgi:hypothetical protein